MQLTDKTAPVIIAPNGTYLGKYETAASTVKFLGIPFGNAERWKRAVDMNTTSEDRIPADQYGPAPWQNNIQWGTMAPAGLSADCLNLNLYMADTAKTDKAVMVWIYGGAQIAGSNVGCLPCAPGMLPLSYDGSKLVRENPDIILVVPNYRVGMWGSLDLSGLPDTNTAYQYSNNLARLDILQCLRWIRKNIKAFGGNPENITLFGQSAGSCNITALMLMEEAQGLFQKVICQSSFAADISLTTCNDSRTVSNALLSALDCSTLEHALKKSDKELLEAQNKIASASMGGSSAFSSIESKLFAPVIDGITIPEDYWQRFSSGCCGRVLFLGGTNAGEYDQQFTGLPLLGQAEAARQLTVSQNWGKLDPVRGFAPEITDLFCSHYADCRSQFQAFMDLKGDLYLRMGAMAYAMVCACNKGAYLYHLALPLQDGSRFGHGREIPILFAYDCESPMYLQKQIRGAWCSFARSGDPNCESLPVRWLPFTRENQETLVIGKETLIVHGLRSKDTELLMPLLREYRRCPEFAALWQFSKS